jgi:hypothetical protein
MGVCVGECGWVGGEGWAVSGLFPLHPCTHTCVCCARARVQVASWYKAGETYDAVFAGFSSAMEECKAETVGVLLCLDPRVPPIFGLNDPATVDDVIYINWLSMVRVRAAPSRTHGEPGPFPSRTHALAHAYTHTRTRTHICTCTQSSLTHSNTWDSVARVCWRCRFTRPRRSRGGRPICRRATSSSSQRPWPARWP